jgi:hypothetical protein
VIGQRFFEPIGSDVAVMWQCSGRGWTNQRAGNNFTHRTTAAVPIGSVLAVIAVLPPSQEEHHQHRLTHLALDACRQRQPSLLVSPSMIGTCLD